MPKHQLEMSPQLCYDVSLGLVLKPHYSVYNINRPTIVIMLQVFQTYQDLDVTEDSSFHQMLLSRHDYRMLLGDPP